VSAVGVTTSATTIAAEAARCSSVGVLDATSTLASAASEFPSGHIWSVVDAAMPTRRRH